MTSKPSEDIPAQCAFKTTFSAKACANNGRRSPEKVPATGRQKCCPLIGALSWTSSIDPLAKIGPVTGE